MRIDRPDREWAAFIAGARHYGRHETDCGCGVIVAGVATGALYFRGDSPRGEAGPDLSTGGGPGHRDPQRHVLDLRRRRRADLRVDGDTFWFRGEKIRIADIDAPELSHTRWRCARPEPRRSGKAAVAALLNAGPFTLVAARPRPGSLWPMLPQWSRARPLDRRRVDRRGAREAFEWTARELVPVANAPRSALVAARCNARISLSQFNPRCGIFGMIRGRYAEPEFR